MLPLCSYRNSANGNKPSFCWRASHSYGVKMVRRQRKTFSEFSGFVINLHRSNACFHRCSSDHERARRPFTRVDLVYCTSFSGNSNSFLCPFRWNFTISKNDPLFRQTKVSKFIILRLMTNKDIWHPKVAGNSLQLSF